MVVLSFSLICSSFFHTQKYEEMNLDPVGTNASGLCGVNSSELTLVSNNMKIVFTFANVRPNLTLFFLFVEKTTFRLKRDFVSLSGSGTSGCRGWMNELMNG